MPKKNDHDLPLIVHDAYLKLKKSYQELRSSHIEMIFRMALMAEYRDPMTGEHLVRIADYSAIIAEAVGLPPKEVEIIRYASPMHDIGKIMLPDRILKKKGTLTVKEKDFVKKHPQVGAEIFKNAKSPIMKACQLVALTHHERFDGTGYPSKLKGEDIPLYGRIVALADCFDAYTSERSYHKACDFDQAVTMIVERAGTHFDPAVVMAFVRSKEKIKKSWEANRDIKAFLDDMGVNVDKFLPTDGLEDDE